MNTKNIIENKTNGINKNKPKNLIKLTILLLFLSLSFCGETKEEDKDKANIENVKDTIEVRDLSSSTSLLASSLDMNLCALKPLSLSFSPSIKSRQNIRIKGLGVYANTTTIEDSMHLNFKKSLSYDSSDDSSMYAVFGYSNTPRLNNRPISFTDRKPLTLEFRFETDTHQSQAFSVTLTKSCTRLKLTSKDDDGDGVLDTRDDFPYFACASLDTDKDGVPDDLDKSSNPKCTAQISFLTFFIDDKDDTEDSTITDVLAYFGELTDDDDDGDFVTDENDDYDEDGIPDKDDDCPRGDTGWTSSGTTDIDDDGCQDSDEDTDDDNDNTPDGSDNCPLISNTDQLNTDKDNPISGDAGDELGDACDTDDDNDGLLDNDETIEMQTVMVDNVARICSLFRDCDNDGLADNEAIEQTLITAGKYCALHSDCDGDGLPDGHAIERTRITEGSNSGQYCALHKDCDGDDTEDNDAKEKTQFASVYCALKADCDADNVPDKMAQEQALSLIAGKTTMHCFLLKDCDGDTLLDDHIIEQTLMTAGTNMGQYCARYTDCDGDTIPDNDAKEQLRKHGTNANQNKYCALSANCDDAAPGDATDRDIDGNDLVEISTVAHLAELRTNLSGPTGFTGCSSSCAGWELINNLNLGGSNWDPIGNTNSSRFTATLNGNNHTLSNLTIDRASNFNGLFGHVGAGAAISNLNISNVNINSAGQHVGALIGSVYDTSRSARILIENVHILSGTVRGSTQTGGLIGITNDTVAPFSETNSLPLIKNSSSAVNVIGSGSDIGGLVGRMDDSIIENSYATGNVSTKAGTNGNNIGGLVGYQWSSNAISGSYATGRVTGGNTSYNVGGLIGESRGNVTYCYSTIGSVYGYQNIGGFIGYQNSSTTVSYSYSTKDVEGKDVNIGGLSGISYGRVENSFAKGDVTFHYSKRFIGGLVGSHHGTTINSFSSGEVKYAGGNNGNWSGDKHIGSLFGYNTGSGVTNSYSVSRVTLVFKKSDNSYDINKHNSRYIGGITGTGGRIINSYYTDDAHSTRNHSNSYKSRSQLGNYTNGSPPSGWTTTNWDFGTTSELPGIIFRKGTINKVCRPDTPCFSYE